MFLSEILNFDRAWTSLNVDHIAKERPLQGLIALHDPFQVLEIFAATNVRSWLSAVESGTIPALRAATHYLLIPSACPEFSELQLILEYGQAFGRFPPGYCWRKAFDSDHPWWEVDRAVSAWDRR